jgi:DNA-binding NarL/FixJ family response regulator
VFVIADTEESAADLASLLSEDERLEVVGTAAAASVFLSMINETHPDVLLVSRATPAQIRAASIPIVLLTDERTEASDFPRLIKARLPVQVTPPEAFAALIAAGQGLTVLTPSQAEALLDSAAQSVTAEPTVSLIEALTRREIQVLRMMAQGLANKEIAEQLGISDHTAKFHVASVLGKLGASSRAEAVALGIRNGMIPI